MAFFQHKRELFFFRVVTVIVLVSKFLNVLWYFHEPALVAKMPVSHSSTVQSHKLVSEELVNRSYGLPYH